LKKLLELRLKGLKIGKKVPNPNPKDAQINFTMSKFGLEVLFKRKNCTTIMKKKKII
jgi:hypothetical protein